MSFSRSIGWVRAHVSSVNPSMEESDRISVVGEDKQDYSVTFPSLSCPREVLKCVETGGYHVHGQEVGPSTFHQETGIFR